MRRIAELPILVKGLLVVVLGIASEIAIAAFAAQGLTRVKETYSQAIDQEAQAAFQLASRYLQGIQRQALRLADHEAEAAQAPIRERLGVLARSLDDRLGQAAAANPALAAPVADLRRGIDEVNVFV